MAHVTCPEICLKVIEFSMFNRFIFMFFTIEVAVSFPVITLSIEFQISHPGIVLETRDQELSFGTKIYGILFIIDEDISS